jgi:cell pole-organizing protein PopZ
MAETATQQTESMEDILNSIRRIIANDPDGSTPNEATDEEPLELTEVMQVGSPLDNTETVDPMDAINDAMMSTGMVEETQAEAPRPEPVFVPTAAPIPQPAYVAPPATIVAVVREDSDDSLLTNSAAETSAHALKNLVNSIPKPKVETMLMRSGSTLEDLVVESLKPELSEWLNKNLPTLVQSLVEKEIRKLIPRD